MSDIYAKVEICALTLDGKRIKSKARRTCETRTALVDTGATQTVISPQLSDTIRGRILDIPSQIEDREVPQTLTAITLKARSCPVQALVVAVDDTLTRRAGSHPETNEPIEIILGHDYLQRERAGIRYDRGAVVACHVDKLQQGGQLLGADKRGRKK